ncbi:MAG: FkbM family methyltransferase [Phormidium tanganyikae FI6-MK23]|jgi:FkbM family methyltransferase|nr:FkbM family methyltransferase [Phormidium tanganyikae FI6-MK23]
MSIPTTTLPNGTKVYYLREEEVPILYQQIQAYLRHDIELQPGDTLFDVGANIGLFSLWAYKQCQHHLHVYAFEPIPAIFEVLQCNVQQCNSVTVKAFPWGLAQEPKTVEFGYYPNATALSTAYLDDGKQTRAIIKQTISQALMQPTQEDPAFIHLLRWFPPFVRSLLIEHKLNQAFQVERVSCTMRTVSEMIREHHIQRIDLLKVDVEKSELDVLLGIEPQDWGKIKQVVVEVHNLENRVAQVMRLLQNHGLSRITVEQEPGFKDSDIFNLYALR